MASTLIIYQGTGSQTDYTVPFDYLKKTFVTVSLEGELLKGGDPGDTGADYYFIDKTTVRLKVAPPAGQFLTVRRYTSATERVVTFKDASVLKANDLDTSQLQAFHIAEEARDIINDALIQDKFDNWDAKNHRIVNVADPVNPQDVVTYKVYKEDAQGAYQSRLGAQRAQAAAQTAQRASQTAQTASEQAQNRAKQWATKMDGKVNDQDYSSKYYANRSETSASVAGDAETQAKEAQRNAEAQAADAKASAATATTKASEASQSATAASQSASSASASASAAKTSQTNAKTSETNAKASETKAGQILAQITTEGQAQVQAITAEGTKQVGLVTSTGTTQTGLVTAQGDKQVKAVTDTSTAQIAKVTAEGAKQVQAVKDQGTTSVGLVTAEGTKQVQSVTTEGTTQVNLAKAQVTKATSQADRAKSQADRAKQYAQYASKGQVQSDWTQTDSADVAFIKNKPVLATVATSGSYNDLTDKPVIPDPTWDNVQNKPSTFPPSTHTHAIADVTGLQTALDGKQPVGDYATNTALTQGLAGKLGKTQKAASATLADRATVADSATTATTATKATQDASGNDIPSTYATKSEVTSGLAGKAPTTHTHTIANVTDLQAKLDELSTKVESSAGLPMGHHYAWPFGTVPANSIQCNGSTYSRTLYADFWQWLQDNNLVKTDSEWNSIASANGGYCHWYSDGDGSTTFRTPKFTPLTQLAIASGNVGNYHKSGLPDITGKLANDNHGILNSNLQHTSSTINGVFSKGVATQYGVGGAANISGFAVNFAASSSNTTHGRSDPVQPEFNKWRICVVVLGQATNVGSADVANVMSAIAQVQADVGAIETNPVLNAKAYITKTWNSGTSWYRVYSDGFIIQSGFHPNRDSGGNPATITLPKPFATTNYAVFRSPINFRKEASVLYITGIITRDTTSFTYNNDSGKFYDGCVWIAAGY